MQTPEARCQTPDAPVLVCFALKEEAAPFRKIAAGKSGISQFSSPASGARTPKNPCANFWLESNRSRASHARQPIRQPELVLTCGFAGGLNPDLKLGDVVFEILLR